MFVCENCFNDEEIQVNIRNHNQIGECDLCGCCGVHIIDIDDFEDFFTEILRLFHKDDNGEDVVSCIQRDWDIFADDSFASKIINYFLGKSNLPYSLIDKVDYIANVNKYIDKWNELKYEIRTKTRFYSSLMSYFDDKGSLLKSNLMLVKGEQFYRARIVPARRLYLTKKEMGCPPADKATPGRANPVGIPYLYLCKSPETTLYETRAVYLDKVTIGTFRLVRDLNILDFTSSISLYLAFNGDVELKDAVAQYRLMQRISNDLSKPLRRYDTDLEYVPTQSICEYCKMKGIDGIIFRSSLHKDGMNLVLFDEESAECVKVKKIEVTKVSISYK